MNIETPYDLGDVMVLADIDDEKVSNGSVECNSITISFVPIGAIKTVVAKGANDVITYHESDSPRHVGLGYDDIFEVLPEQPLTEEVEKGLGVMIRSMLPGKDRPISPLRMEEIRAMNIGRNANVSKVDVELAAFDILTLLDWLEGREE